MESFMKLFLDYLFTRSGIRDSVVEVVKYLGVPVVYWPIQVGNITEYADRN